MAALEGPQNSVAENNEIYRRLDRVASARTFSEPPTAYAARYHGKR